MVAGLAASAAVSAQAGLIGYTAGTAAGGGIIAAPALVTDAAVVNTAQQGFDERQGVLLAAPLNVDGAVDVPAGTWVDSHMIFLNKSGAGSLNDTGVKWLFSGTILGVMSDINGNLEAASTALLGALGSTYQAPFGNRGLESDDSYSIAGNQLTVNMHVSQPGDWIRVVTVHTPDAGSTLSLGAFAGLGLLLARRFAFRA